jgi:hypothetical protein
MSYVEFYEGIVSLMWDKRKGSQSTTIVKSYVLALTSSKGSQRRVLIIYLPWMGGRFHYHLMGLSSNHTSMKPYFFRALGPK